MWEIMIPSLPSEWVPGTMASKKLLSPTGLGRNLLIVVMIEYGKGETILGTEIFFKEFSWNSCP